MPLLTDTVAGEERGYRLVGVHGDGEEEAEDEDGDAQAFVIASSLVSTIQPFASATTTSPPLPDAEDGGGSAAFRAHLHTLVGDPVKVELALMERRYFDSWKVLRTSPDLSVSFLFVPSDPDFLPRFRKDEPLKAICTRLGAVPEDIQFKDEETLDTTIAKIAKEAAAFPKYSHSVTAEMDWTQYETDM